MNKRKIVLLALSLCMVAILAVGGTLAYFTDTDQAVNVFTVGNVKIEQYEQQRDGNGGWEDFEQNQKLFPIVNDGKDENGYHTGKNYIDKIVTVKNTGTEDAYIRTHIAVPHVLDDGADTYMASDNILHWNGASANDTFGLANSGELDNDWYWDATMTKDWPGNGGAWHSYETTVTTGEGENAKTVKYTVYVATHKAIVPAGKTTSPNLFGVYLDAGVDYNPDTDKYIDQKGKEFTFPDPIQILVVSEAVQAAGFDNAVQALNQAFGEPGIDGDPWNGYKKAN